MSRVVAGDCVEGSLRPVGRGGGIAMAEGLAGLVARSRGVAEEGRGIERSSSSKADAMVKLAT
jgi:hypothetical protein